MWIKEQNEKLWRITQEIIPSANMRRSLLLLKSFRDLHYSTMGKIEIIDKVIAAPQEYLKFCETRRCGQK